MSKFDELGRWHKWWLKQFYKAYNDGKVAQTRGERRGLGIAVQGYEGTVQGKALSGLLGRGLISFQTSFEGGIAILTITDEGRSYYE